MISPSEYIQLKAFARQDGFFIGLLWVFTFACFVCSMSSPDVQIGFIAGLMVSPFVVYFRLKHFRDKILGGKISFKRAFLYLAFVVVDASIILAAATFIYFYFLDNGVFMSRLHESMSLPEVKQSFTQAGMDVETIDKQLQLFSETRPIDIAFGIFFNTMISGFILALILSAIGHKAEPVKR